MDWWIWLIVAIVLVVVEMLTLDLVLLMIAGGALAAALASGLGVDNLLVQGLIWAVVSLLLLGTARRWMLERFRGATHSAKQTCTPTWGRQHKPSPTSL